MDTPGQLKLLLWKDFLVRKRHLGVASLVFGWGITVFLILYIVRESVDPEYIPTCQYKARALPSAGLFPFVQSFICNVDNKCGDINHYEEVPRYGEARLTGLAEQLTKVFTNNTITGVIKSLPNMIGLLKSVGKGLDSPGLQDIFGPGVKISNLFNNPDQVKQKILSKSVNLGEDVIDEVFDSSLKFGHLLQSMGSTDMASIICDPKQLEQYLILQNPDDIQSVANGLCSIDGKIVPELLETLITHIDLSGLIKMIEKVVNHFKNYNMYEDIGSMVSVMLNLKTIQNYLPVELKLQQWLPQIFPPMKFLNHTYFDAKFVINAVDIIEPYFKTEKSWPIIKNLILKIADFIETIQHILIEKIKISKYVPEYYNNLRSESLVLSNATLPNVQEMFTSSFKFVKQFQSELGVHWLQLANIMDLFVELLNKEILNYSSTISFIYSKVILTLQNIIRNYYEAEEIMYNLSEKNPNTVSTVLSLGPEFSKSLLNCLNNITCTSVIIQNKNNLSKIFCSTEEIQRVFPNAAQIKNINNLCNVDFSSFIEDATNDFKLNSLNLTSYTTKREGNFTSAVMNTQNIISYIKEKSKEQNKVHISWEQLFPNIAQTDWNLFEEAQKNKGLLLFNLQLGYLKETLKDRTDLNPILNASSMLMEGVFTGYKHFPVRLFMHLLLNLPDAVRHMHSYGIDKTKVEEIFVNAEQNNCSDYKQDAYSKNICDFISYIYIHKGAPWYFNPLISSVYTIIKNYPKLTDLNWDIFLSNAQNLYLAVDDALIYTKADYEWGMLGQNIQDTLKTFFNQLTVQEQTQYGLNIATDVFNMIDHNYFDSKLHDQSMKIRQIILKVDNLIILVHDVIEFSISTENNTEIRNLYPETFKLSQIIINSLDFIANDINNYYLEEDSDITELWEWMSNPCERNITKFAINFHDQSKRGLEAIQTIACNNTIFLDEWDSSTMIYRKRNGQINVGNMEKLLNEIHKIKNTSGRNIGDWTEFYGNFYHRTLNLEIMFSKIVDKQLEKTVFRNETLSQLWSIMRECVSKNNDCTDIKKDTITYTMRFVATGLNEVINKIRLYLQTITSPNEVDPLTLIGFKNSLVIYNMYLKLPDYAKIFIHSYRSPEFEQKILDKKSKNKTITCLDIVSFLKIPENNEVTPADIKDMGSYICPSLLNWPAIQDNMFLSVIDNFQDLYLQKPVVKLNITYSTLLRNTAHLYEDTLDTIRGGKIHITQLWNEKWLERLKTAFYDIRKLNFTTNNSITRLFKYIDAPNDPLNISEKILSAKYGFGEFSYVLQHVTTFLNKFESYNVSSSDEAEQEAVEALKELLYVYPKEVAGIFTYAYYRSNDYSIWESLQHTCDDDSTVSFLSIYSPSWMIKDENKVYERLCNISYENMGDAVSLELELSSVKHNVNFEDVIIQFISTLLNFMDHNSTIYLSSALKNNLDLTKFVKDSLPTDEQLRSASLEEALKLQDIRHGIIRDLEFSLEMSTILLKILKGGDWWKTMLDNLEKFNALNVFLRFLERIPYIVIHVVDAILTPHFLYKITSKAINEGPRTICRYNGLAFNEMLKNDNIIAVFHELCTDNMHGGGDSAVIDTFYNETHWIDTYKEEAMAELIYKFERNLVDLIQNGSKPFDLPKWLNETDILETYKTFADKNKEPLSLLQSVSSVFTEAIDLGSIFYLKQETEYCEWCSWGTVLVKEMGRQLSNSQKYVDLMCNASHMSFDLIKKSLIDDFHWGEFYTEIMDNKPQSINDFNMYLHDIVNIVRVQLITFYTNKTLRGLPEKCMKQIMTSPELKNVTTYVTAIPDLIKTIKSSSIELLNTTTTIKILNLIKEDIQIFKPVKDIVKIPYLTNDLVIAGFDNTTINQLLNSSIDINLLQKLGTDPVKFQNYLLNNYEKLFSFENENISMEVYDEISNRNVTAISNAFCSNVDLFKISKSLDEWREEGIKDFDWLVKFFDDLEQVLINGGDVLRFIANIDYNSILSDSAHLSSMLKGVLELVQQQSIEKLFISLRQLLKDSSPMLRNQTIENDLSTILNGIENLEIFKSLGLLRLKYNVSNLVANWSGYKKYMADKLHINKIAIDDIYNASIDLTAIFSSQKGATDIQSIICNPSQLSKFLQFPSYDIASDVSNTFCNMDMTDIQNIAEVALKSINFTKILNNVMNSTVNNILTSANMTEGEGRQIVKDIGTGLEILPVLRTMISNVSNEMSYLPKFDLLKSTHADGTSSVISPDLLASASKLLCGRSMAQQNNKLYQKIAETKDFNSEKFDAIEIKSLPTHFCENLYKDIVQMNAGKLLWSFIKPLVRGKILYTPKAFYVDTILKSANTTFENIAELEKILYKITDGLTALEDKDKITHYVENIKEFVNSSIVKIAVQNVIGSVTHNSKFSLDNIDLSDMLNGFDNSKHMSSSLKFGSDLLHCVLLDRFIGFDSEIELEVHAKYLMQRNEFIAGLVFLNSDERSKRSTNEFPRDISYKIRTDIDNVPSTNYLKYKFWTPGPDGDFLDDLRYFRGFIQLQDLIDNAIIKIKSTTELPKWDLLTQQIPYPCWTNDFFKSALSISQTFQVCFFFGLIVIVAAAVRYIVWEKESGNTMVMNVMGLRYHTHCLSWFIVTLIEMMILMISIFIIIKAGGILPKTDGTLLFLYMIEFGWSVIMFCYMISTIFNSASLAAVGSAIFYLLSFMPYIIIIALETTLPFWAQLLTCLSMSTSFCNGCLYIIRFELQGVGLQWSNSWDTPVPGDTMNFGLTCIFLAFDGLLYWFIGYLCSRKTQEFHKLFSLLPSSLCTINKYRINSTTPSYVTFENDLFYNVNSSGDNYLDNTVSSTNIINDEPLKIGVTIKGLTKVYNSRKKTVKAIEDIDITLYTGQVTTLLGHNGAGKTTLIKILTGMMEPTSGQIIINREITEHNNKSTRYLGVCPQGSVLINTMSAVEHLIFYAKLKTSKSTNDVIPEVKNMIDSLSLGLLSNEPVSHLSEGMRRRLCVAIAFIGNPKLVVLDEPSSGVDPVARRQIWDLVIRYKEGCTVLLTTHYFDEAELLSDRVVVLHKGKVLCSGSPSTLKQSYGIGYKIIVTYPVSNEKLEINENCLLADVKEVVPNAILSEMWNNEVSLIVPFNSPEGTPNNFEQVALVLEENQNKLGFSTFSMNCTTLERVFLDLCANEDAKNGEVVDKNGVVLKIGQSYSTVFSNSVSDLPTSQDDTVLIKTGEKITGTLTEKFFALLKKRAIHYLFDWRVIICALILPTLFTAVAMGFSLIRPPNSNEPSLKLSPDLYNTHTTSFISVDTDDFGSFVNKVSQEIVGLSPRDKNLEMYSKTSRNCTCTDGMQKCSKPSNKAYNSLLKLSSSQETVKWLIDTQDEYIERRYGGWSLSELPDEKSAFVVWYNNKGYHTMPSYLNTMNNAILRTVSPGNTITTYNHPLKLSVDQLNKSTVAQHIADVGIAMVLLIAFSLIPASGSIYLVQERVNEEKRLQFLCGVSPTLYWVVAFIWDMIVLLCALVLAVIVFNIFDLPVYVARDNMAAVSLLIFLYGWACIPFVHLAQRLFNDASMANMILFCSCAFIGISELTCLLLMDILGTTQFVADFRIVLHKIYLIFPQFVLGDGLVEISKNNIMSEILQRFHMDTYVSPLSWDLMGLHYLSLTLVGVVLFSINLIIENQWFTSLKKTSAVYPSDTSCLETINLTKEYSTLSGKHVAVNKVSLKVPFGQCLGLIGVNGAGKSTTFKMLTTELRPTSGRIFFQGREIGQKPLFTGEMGYCAQCDSLDPKLTVRQTLMLYLTLRGIANPKEVLNRIMFKFELTSYANRKTENLSGGNKRKLCTALSVLGKTQLILMDEPTSGMDPYSRNLVGLTIQQLTRQNRSVILTSHSVEDCETLCSIVAVMINGEIICRGSPQELKERFGSGYIITVRLSKPAEQDMLLELMEKNFFGAQLMSRQYCSSQFTVPTEQTCISEMFRKMAKISEYVSVEDYHLVQSSLDQVFINLANKSKESVLGNDDIKTTFPDMYSMDVL